MQILIYHGRGGDIYWLADTSFHRTCARKALFNYLDHMGCYDSRAGTMFDEARKGNATAVTMVLEKYRGFEYESWDYAEVRVDNG